MTGIDHVHCPPFIGSSTSLVVEARFDYVRYSGANLDGKEAVNRGFRV